MPTIQPIKTPKSRFWKASYVSQKETLIAALIYSLLTFMLTLSTQAFGQSQAQTTESSNVILQILGFRDKTTDQLKLRIRSIVDGKISGHYDWQVKLLSLVDKAPEFGSSGKSTSFKDRTIVIGSTSVNLGEIENTVFRFLAQAGTIRVVDKKIKINSEAFSGQIEGLNRTHNIKLCLQVFRDLNPPLDFPVPGNVDQNDKLQWRCMIQKITKSGRMEFSAGSDGIAAGAHIFLNGHSADANLAVHE